MLVRMIMMIVGLLFVLDPAFGANCDERKGVLMAQKGQFTAAFVMLEKCATKRNVSADTLMLLAELYENQLGSRIKGEEALMVAWSLKHKAAAKGNLDALIEITRAYGQGGDRGRKVLPNDAMHRCLVDIVHSASGHGKFESESVVFCFKAYRPG